VTPPLGLWALVAQHWRRVLYPRERERREREEIEAERTRRKTRIFSYLLLLLHTHTRERENRERRDRTAIRGRERFDKRVSERVYYSLTLIGIRQ
jgi:hypothetical protein